MKPARLRYPVLGVATIALLAGCASSAPSAVGLQRENRLKLREHVSTRQDVVALMGKSDEVLDMPRLAVPAAVRDGCMQWDQRTIRTMFYFDTYVGKDDGKAWEQETEIFLDAGDRVCTWAVWTWLKGYKYNEKLSIRG